MRRWVAGRSPDRTFYSQALDGSYLPTPDGQTAGSPPSLWITGAAANPRRLPKVGNRWWRSLSAKLVAKGLREPVGAQAISFPPQSPRLQSPSLVGKSAVRIGAATRLAEPRSATADYRARAWRPHRSMHGQERPQPVTKVRVNVPRLPSALPSRDRPRVDMRFTSEAARFGSLVRPATSPLTASMPSRVGLCCDRP